MVRTLQQLVIILCTGVLHYEIGMLGGSNHMLKYCCKALCMMLGCNTKMKNELAIKLEDLGSNKAIDSFSQQVLTGATHALADEQNPLRLVFFATSMRILLEHLQENLAPPDNVLACSWFNPSVSNSGKPSHAQQFKYIIQGGLSTRLVNRLGIATTSLSTNLSTAFQTLHTHVHAEESTLITERGLQDNFASNLLDEMIDFLDTAQHCRETIATLVEKRLQNATLDTFLTRNIRELDEIATSYVFDHIETDDVSITEINHKTVTYRITGTVFVVLEYGSSSDFRKGDGLAMDENFPFSCTVETPVDTPWNLRNAGPVSCTVDNREFYE